MSERPDIVWYRTVKGVGCYAVLPEHPGDPLGETCHAFEPVSEELQQALELPPWVLITTTTARMLRVSRVAWHHEAEPARLWLAAQGYRVEPRPFTLAEVDAERVRRSTIEYFHGSRLR